MRLASQLALLVVLFGAASSGRASGPATPSLLDRPAPGFRLSDTRGQTVSLGDLRGRFVVLHFGASW